MTRFGLFILAFCIWLGPLEGWSQGATTASVGVSATIPSWGYCWFQSASATLPFGNLDPTHPTTVSAQANLSFRCIGYPTVTFYISHDSGLHGSNPNALRLQNSASSTSYIPYTLALNPTSATISSAIISPVQTLTVTGSIAGADYRTAPAGTYADTVVMTIVP